MDLSPFFDCINSGTSSDNCWKSEPIRRSRFTQHAGVEKDAISWGLALQVTSHYGVVDEGIRVGKGVEHLERITQIAIIRECTELDDSAHGVVVRGETKADNLGVKLLELGHARAGFEAAQRGIAVGVARA